jgi:hypothetical protein
MAAIRTLRAAAVAISTLAAPALAGDEPEVFHHRDHAAHKKMWPFLHVRPFGRHGKFEQIWPRLDR